MIIRTLDLLWAYAYNKSRIATFMLTQSITVLQDTLDSLSSDHTQKMHLHFSG